MLRRIRETVFEIAQTKFGVAKNKLRLFVHYHPTYCKLSHPIPGSSPSVDMEHQADCIDHFHVHVVHLQHEANAGMMAGQAHLLDDLITLVSTADSHHFDWHEV